MVLSWFIGKLISAPHRQLTQRERERGILTCFNFRFLIVYLAVSTSISK